MPIKEYEAFVDAKRDEFLKILRSNHKFIEYDGDVISFKDWIIKECFGPCCSAFEEQIMAENLAEVFRDFMDKESGGK